MDDTPRRFRWPVDAGSLHPNGWTAEWRHGCYFPLTDLVVTDMGARGTGAPDAPGIESIDRPPEGRGPAAATRTPPTFDEMLGPAHRPAPGGGYAGPPREDLGR